MFVPLAAMWVPTAVGLALAIAILGGLVWVQSRDPGPDADGPDDSEGGGGGRRRRPPPPPPAAAGGGGVAGLRAAVPGVRGRRGPRGRARPRPRRSRRTRAGAERRR